MTSADRKLIAELRASGMHAEAAELEAALVQAAKTRRKAEPAQESNRSLVERLRSEGLLREAHELRAAIYAEQHPRALVFANGAPSESWSAKLVEGPLFPRSSGSLDAAMRQAGFLAARDGTPYVVYWGPASGGKGNAWHASSQPGLFASHAAHTGKIAYLVLPNLSVFQYEVQHRAPKE